MIADLKPYPSYKDSGVPWLGEVPEHWELRRNGNLFSQRNETGFPALPILEVSLKTGVRVREFSSNGRKQVMSERKKYKRAAQGDIAYNMMRLWQGAVGVAPVDGLISPAYVVARPHPRTDAHYYRYLFRTSAYMAQVNEFSRGIVSDRNRLYWEDFKRMPSPLPPPEEQSAIVRFLDYVGQRIRRYIQANQKLIKLLEEQKQAIIHRAVTRGLDPNVRLKPSGVEWLGAVPEHWEIRRIKMLCSMRSGEGITAISIEGSGEYPVYGGNGIRGYTSNYTHYGAFALIGRQGALCGNVHIVKGRFWASEHALVARLHPSHDLEWFGAVLTAMNLNQYSIAAAQPGLAVERISDLWLPVPPMQEQACIAKYILSKMVETQRAIDHAYQEISLLHKYRTRLIADVVTGKLDVREAAARLPEEVEEPELQGEELVVNGTEEEPEEDEFGSREEADA